MKKLPIGIQSIVSLIEGDYVYVDKTMFAKKLIDEGKYYFMSRPRRFGKSLFLSTLEEILKGNKKLFSECYIFDSDYEWDEHPIIHFDFTKIPTRSPESLEQGLYETMDKIAEGHGVSLRGSSLQLRLSDLVEKLSTKNKVVVLVDEYDKPIIDNLLDVEKAETNRDILRSFFGTLKGLDKHLRFVFITGVSKFSQVSLFSGFNNLQDLTMDPGLSTVTGYTKGELEQSFGQHINVIASKKGLTFDAVVSEIKEWYNGYCFAEDCDLVFNPFSTLSYLKTGLPKSYWFSTGTPSFLFKYAQQHSFDFKAINGCVYLPSLENAQNLHSIDIHYLLWQVGYLTIKRYDRQLQQYELGFPNREVESAYCDRLLQQFKHSPFQTQQTA